ncbi:MAG: dethiobiotin synthase [Proteobacteria bacterium]|nr:dethiobiotin synthase [Pseudomonadota bacterium]
MIPPRVFVTGTDTDVGKTVVSAAICAADGRVGLKPIASGVTGGPQDDAPRIGSPRSPFSYEKPVSPHRAAPDEILLDAVLAWIDEHAAPRMLVEGVGGWRVPISWSFGVPELARALGFPVLVVAADRLGALNHTLLTVDAIRRDGLEVCGVVLNDAHRASVPTNLDDLRRLLDVPVGTFAHAGREIVW